MRPPSVPTVFALALAFAGAARADANLPPVAHWDRDPRWVIGQVTVNASPDAVMSRLQRVDRWPAMLTDIEHMRVAEHKDPLHWKIELESRSLEHGMLPYKVDFEGARRLHVYAHKPGVTVSAITVVRDGPTSGQANVVYEMFIEVSGVPHLLISDASLRQKQEHIVEVTLRDLERAFPASR